MREYDQDTLKKVQRAELSILKDFIDLCEKHGLVYFGIAGTGIGALRHGGFIPWDDDIDVAMPREDYNRFCTLVKEERADRYLLMNTEENENYPLMTARLMLRGTEFREEVLKDIDCPLGIFLDLYPLDKLSDDPAEMPGIDDIFEHVEPMPEPELPKAEDIPDTKWDVPDVKADIPDTKWDVPDVNADIPDTKWDVPDVNADIPDLPEIPDIPTL